MLEIVKSGGWLMLPIILCGIAALGIVAERFWTLQKNRVMPDNLLQKIWQLEASNKLETKHLKALSVGSPLGRVLAAGFNNRHHSREVIKESIEETGRHVVHELELFLNSLGTIAAVSPLLGLLGTVVGMIKVFATITSVGVGNPTELAEGISQALTTTAAGLGVAIPALIFHRYFRGKVDEYVVFMEQESIKLVEALQGQREQDL